MILYAPIDIKSYCTAKIYAYAGEAVEVIQDGTAVHLCKSLRGEMFPCAAIRLTDVNPNITEQKEHPLLIGFKVQLQKMGRTKYKALIGAVEDGLIKQALPDEITKTEWLILAKGIL